MLILKDVLGFILSITALNLGFFQIFSLILKHFLGSSLVLAIGGTPLALFVGPGLDPASWLALQQKGRLQRRPYRIRSLCDYPRPGVAGGNSVYRKAALQNGTFANANNCLSRAFAYFDAGQRFSLNYELIITHFCIFVSDRRHVFGNLFSARQEWCPANYSP